MFIGSSAMYAYVSPPRLYLDTGIRSYLYATPNQSMAMIRHAIEECRRTQPDALYVIELRAMLSSAQDREAIASDVRRMTDNMPYTLHRMRMIHELAPEEERLSWYFDLIKYHERWKECRWEDLSWTWGRENAWKGWTFSTQVQPTELRDYGRVNARIRPDEENEKEFLQLLAYCDVHDVSAVFLATPFPISRRQAKIYNAVGDMADANGDPFWNLCRRFSQIGLDGGTDFADDHHVNTLGALKTTGYLEKELVQLVSDRTAGMSSARRSETQSGRTPEMQSGRTPVRTEKMGEPFLQSEEAYLEAEQDSLRKLQENGAEQSGPEELQKNEAGRPGEIIGK